MQVAVQATVDRLQDPTFINCRFPKALVRIGPPEVAVPALVDLLRRGVRCMRIAAADALGTMGPAAAAAIPDLAEALDDEFILVQFSAVDALGQLGPTATSAIPALIAFRTTMRDTYHNPRQLARIDVVMQRIQGGWVLRQMLRVPSVREREEERIQRKIVGPWNGSCD
jgi:HEAT repeat protein